MVELFNKKVGWEIGGEFCEKEDLFADGVCQDRTTKYCISGRTAIDIIAKDILSCNCSKSTPSIWLPSYCCESMIIPFKKNAYNISFYDVFIDKEKGIMCKLPSLKSGDVLYINNYFGFTNGFGEGILDIPKDIICIYDATHDIRNYSNSFFDYTCCSFRKWTFVPEGATAVKNGFFSSSIKMEKQNGRYSFFRIQAAKEKLNYLNSGKGQKKEYLDLYSMAETDLETNYENFESDYLINGKVINSDFVKKISGIRRRNAEYLLGEIEKIDWVTPVFDIRYLNDGHTIPLCVPILINAKRRDAFRKHMIDNNVFLPIHWPISEHHKGISSASDILYQCCISIVCDQRYDIGDMEKMIKIIKEFRYEY